VRADRRQAASAPPIPLNKRARAASPFAAPDSARPTGRGHEDGSPDHGAVHVDKTGRRTSGEGRALLTTAEARFLLIAEQELSIYDPACTVVENQDAHAEWFTRRA